jgi:hypothetical protein
MRVSEANGCDAFRIEIYSLDTTRCVVISKFMRVSEANGLRDTTRCVVISKFMRVSEANGLRDTTRCVVILIYYIYNISYLDNLNAFFFATMLDVILSGQLE